MNEHNSKQTLRTEVMEAIEKGRVRMKPRWHFILLSLLVATGSVIVAMTLLYVVSLAMFLLRDSGMWFAPSFGKRGWIDLFQALPVVLILLVVLFVLLLEVLVRRYAFVYRKPLLVSVFGITLLICAGGFLIVQTPFHRNMALFAEHHQLPPPLDMLYGPSFRGARPPDAYRGIIVARTAQGFIMKDPDNDATSTVVLTPQTRLPYGENFAEGATVLVMGDVVATGTIEAYGVRELDENR